MPSDTLLLSELPHEPPSGRLRFALLLVLKLKEGNSDAPALFIFNSACTTRSAAMRKSGLLTKAVAIKRLSSGELNCCHHTSSIACCLAVCALSCCHAPSKTTSGLSMALIEWQADKSATLLTKKILAKLFIITPQPRLLLDPSALLFLQANSQK